MKIVPFLLSSPDGVYNIDDFGEISIYNEYNIDHTNRYHLYLLLDVLIRVGDYYLNNDENSINICSEITDTYNCSKIVASTKYGVSYNIPDTFIVSFIEYKNNGSNGDIFIKTDIKINQNTLDEHTNIRLDDDNNVSLSIIKSTFTRAEVAYILSHMILHECTEYSTRGNGFTYLYSLLDDNGNII